MKKPRILFIEPNASFVQEMTNLLCDEFDCITAKTSDHGIHAIHVYNPQLVLLASQLSEKESGIEVVQQIHQHDSSLPVIIMADEACIEQAVKAMRFGAYSYINKQPKKSELRLLIKEAIKNRTWVLMHQSLKEAAEQPFYTMIGESEPMQLVMEKVLLYAQHHSTVLITGESGVGKELVARQIHVHSEHKRAPFIAINCAAIPKELAESELFGHEKGAFTGAEKRKLGKFEMAGEGVVFLDEISELSPDIQVKLLRILQEKEFNRVGGNETIKTNAKIIAATNKDLFELVKIGAFREDLFYRLDVLPIQVPALRDRKEDIPVLVQHFIGEVCQEMKLKPKTCSTQALQKFCEYDWPGNIRQLKNYITRAVILCHGNEIGIEHLDFEVRNTSIPYSFLGEAPKTWEEMDAMRKVAAEKASRAVEQLFVDSVLKTFQGNISKAALAIGINRSNLHKLIKRASAS